MLGFFVYMTSELLHVLGAGDAPLDDFGIPGNDRKRRLELMRYVARETTALRHLRIEAFALFIKAIDKGTSSSGTLAPCGWSRSTAESSEATLRDMTHPTRRDMPTVAKSTTR